MEAWYLPAALALLAVACLVMGLVSAESRPGFEDGRVDRKDRWFFHSKHATDLKLDQVRLGGGGGN